MLGEPEEQFSLTRVALSVGARKSTSYQHFHVALRQEIGFLMSVGAVLGWLLASPVRAADLGPVPRYHVIEIRFDGPQETSVDTPARDVELIIVFRHEETGQAVRLHGFWDGDGRGGNRGNTFCVRFCPPRTGQWQIVETLSNRSELRGQRVGDTVRCTASKHPGFWIADGRWYRRSDGSHPYIVGNTHYSFLSRQTKDGPTKTNPLADIRANARFFCKLRFALFGDRYPNPTLKPFLDDKGQQTEDGAFSLRPNPAWFHQHVDPVVSEAFVRDLICDMILCGPDTRASRSTLKGNSTPWLEYVAARYGSYPNIWFCLANEWNIKNPSYTAAEIRKAGEVLRAGLPHATPISVHSKPGDWDKALNGNWCDHTIIQQKCRTLERAADAASPNYALGGGKPVVNDENAYQGKGDAFSLGDTVEGCFGTFLGGGYPTTGEKYKSKLGQYFWGGFDAKVHTAAPRLGYLRAYVDRSIAFWRLAPLVLAKTPFAGLDPSFRVLGRDGEEYVLGSDRPTFGNRVTLPKGGWRITQVDLIAMTTRTLASRVSGVFGFDTPPSRAALTHFRHIGGAGD